MEFYRFLLAIYGLELFLLKMNLRQKHGDILFLSQFTNILYKEGYMDLQILEAVRKYAMGCESASRYEHSLRVAETAEKMCLIYGLDTSSGYFVGLAHDMCKEMNPRLITSLAKRDGEPISLLEQEKPSLLHGRAAAAKLKYDFNVEDQDILDAIRFHTFGSPYMGPLAKILYAADKIEPERSQVSSDYYRELFSMPLNDLVLYVAKENVDYLSMKGKYVAEITLQMISVLEGKTSIKLSSK